MQFRSWGITDKGMKRSNNQDSFLIDESLKLFVVADGMGGHKGGEVASAIAAETAKQVVQNAKMNEHPRNLLQKIFIEASQRIFDTSSREHELKGMGTTMVLALLREDLLYIGNVGDSRCYLFQEDRLWSMTEDHSLVYEQLRTGQLSEEDLPNFQAKNIITRSVGFEQQIECDVVERSILPGDRFILCSDGLHGILSHERMTGICTRNETSDWAPILIQAANDEGGDDNITVLVIETGPSKI